MYPFKNGENDDALIVSTTINFQKKKKRNLLAGQHFTKNLTQQGPFFYFPPYKVVTSSAYTVWGT